MSLDLVVVGNLIIDDIVKADGSTRMGEAGGAAFYLALSGSLWGLSVAVSSVAGSDYPKSLLVELERRGVELAGIRQLDQPGLRTWLLYEGSVRRVLHHLNSATHLAASTDPGDFPPSWRPRAVHLGPLPWELQRRWIDWLRQNFGDELLLSLDPFELLTAANLEDWREMLADVDVLFLSEDEVAQEVDRLEPGRWLRRLGIGGPTTIFYKRGGRGGLMVSAREERFLEWLPRATRVVDPTGAGDAFAAGVLASLLRGEDHARAIGRGVVSASFAIEAEGTSGLLAASRQALADRYEAWFGSNSPTRTGGGTARSRGIA